MAKKKKISKTEKELRGKLRYQQSKLAPIKKELQHYKKLDARKKYNYDGKLTTKKAILNKILQKAYKVNNTLVEIQNKLHRFKYKPKSNFRGSKLKSGIQIDDFKVWQKNDVEKSFFNVKNPPKIVNGINLKENADKVSDLVDLIFMSMTSTDLAIVKYDHKKKEIEIYISNGEDNEDESE